jgi:hypothetical protein
LSRALLLRLLSLLTGVAASLLVAELCCWLLPARTTLLPEHYDERNLAYRYDSTLGWFPTENKQGRYTDTRTISYRDNPDGFRDSPHGRKTRPRVAFLGDSFVWGYDVEQDERFTERLRQAWPEREVLNLGVSGYGTDQEYLLLRRFYERHRPDLVVLVVFPDNDREDNSTNLRYEGYYKPYFVTTEGRLEERGIPVPRSANYYRVQAPWLFESRLFNLALGGYSRIAWPELHNPDPTIPILSAVHDYLRARRTAFAIGLVDRDPELESFCRRRQIECVNLETSLRDEVNGHWTAEGHAFVARRLHDALASGGSGQW